MYILNMRTKLNMTFGLILIIPILIVSFVMYRSNAEEFKNNAYEGNSQMAVAVSRQIELLLQERLNLLKAASNFPEIVSMDTNRQGPIMKSFAKEYKDMGSLIITDVNGQQTIRTVGTLANVSDRQYFKEIKNGVAYSISDVLIAKGTGKASIVLAVPIKRGQETIGLLLGVLDLQEISQSVSNMKFKQHGYVYLTDRGGKTLAHPDKKMVQEEMKVGDLEPVRRALAGEVGATRYSFDGTDKIAGFSPVALAGWATVVQVPEEEVMTALNKTRSMVIGIILISCFLALVVGHFLATSFTRPLLGLISTAEALADGDLTRRIASTGKGEIGKLTVSFMMMTDKLRQLIEQIIQVTSQVLLGSKDINVAFREMKNSVEDISALSQQLSDSAGKQQAEITYISTEMNKMSQFMGEVAKQAQETTGFAKQAVKASKTGRSATQNTVVAMSAVSSEVHKTGKLIEQLGSRSKEIGGILSVITGIAGQTNLLALNASIEAARSGEHGRGFAVVADEIRKLAEQSQLATGQIGALIGQIQEDTDKAVAGMQGSLARVEDGVIVVNQADQSLQAIDDSVAGSVRMAEEILRSVVQQEQSILQVTQEINELTLITRENTEKIHRVAVNSEGVTANAERVLLLAESLEQVAITLTSTTEKFKK